MPAWRSLGDERLVDLTAYVLSDRGSDAAIC